MGKRDERSERDLVKITQWFKPTIMEKENQGVANNVLGIVEPHPIEGIDVNFSLSSIVRDLLCEMEERVWQTYVRRNKAKQEKEKWRERQERSKLREKIDFVMESLLDRVVCVGAKREEARRKR